MKKLTQVLAVLAIAGWAGAANSTIIVEGSFTAEFADFDDLSGSFAATFDDSVVTGVGTEELIVSGVDSLTFLPNPLVGNAFDETNVGMGVRYVDGVLFQVLLGALANPFDIGDFLGDWAVRWTADDGEFELAAAANIETEEGLDFTFATSGSGALAVRSLNPNPVPAPASLALIALGLAGLGYSRRKKA